MKFQHILFLCVCLIQIIKSNQLENEHNKTSNSKNYSKNHSQNHSYHRKLRSRLNPSSKNFNSHAKRYLRHAEEYETFLDNQQNGHSSRLLINGAKWNEIHKVCRVLKAHSHLCSICTSNLIGRKRRSIPDEINRREERKVELHDFCKSCRAHCNYQLPNIQKFKNQKYKIHKPKCMSSENFKTIKPHKCYNAASNQTLPVSKILKGFLLHQF